MFVSHIGSSLFVYIFVGGLQGIPLQSAKFDDYEVHITMMVLEELYHWGCLLKQPRTFFFLDCKFSQKSEKCGKNIRKMACFVVKEGLKSDNISEKKCFF